MTTKKAKKSAHKPAKKAHTRRNPSAPPGMVMVPISMMTGGTVDNPKKKKRRSSGQSHHSHHPQKRNPPEEETSPFDHVKTGAKAAAFGALAAIAGVFGGVALTKANLQGKATNALANAAAGVIVGGGLGMADRTAGTLVAHNFMVAAAQHALGSSTVAPAARRLAMDTTRALPNGARAGAAGMTAAMMQKGRALSGASELEGYEPLQGVVADNMGSAEEFSGYENLQGVVADNMGDSDRLDGLDPDVGNESELSGSDEYGSLFGDD